MENNPGSFRDTKTALVAFFDFFSKQPPEVQNGYVEMMLKYIDAEPKTIESWARGNCLPKGKNLLCLKVFLQDQQMENAEFEGAIPSELVHLSHLIAKKFVSMEETSKAIGFSDVDEFSRCLRGKRKCSEERMKIVKAILGRYNIEDVLKPIVIRVVAPVHAEIEPKYNEEEQSRIITAILDGAFACKIIVLNESLEKILKNDDPTFRDRLRNALRTTLGSNFVFELSNNLYLLNARMNAFCSEKSREIYNKEKKGE